MGLFDSILGGATTGGSVGGPWGAAIGGGLGLIAGLSGAAQAEGDRSRSLQLSEEAYRNLANLSAPDIEKLKVHLEGYKSAGQIAPETEQALLLSSKDALQDIQLDPKLRQAKLQQLESLQQLGQAGLTQSELFEMNRMRQQVESDAQARTKQMLEQQQARGVGSSESALAARLINSQASANRQAQATQDLAGQAFNRALQAKSQAADLAGNIENVDYSRQANLAQNLNQREIQNLQQRASAQQRNIDRFNRAQEANLASTQGIMSANVDVRNKEALASANAEQQRFENEMRKRQLASGQAVDLSKTYQSRGDTTASGAIEIAKGVGNLATTLFSK
jgi:hypothetical protein